MYLLIDHEERLKFLLISLYYSIHNAISNKLGIQISYVISYLHFQANREKIVDILNQILLKYHLWQLIFEVNY